MPLMKTLSTNRLSVSGIVMSLRVITIVIAGVVGCYAGYGLGGFGPTQKMLVTVSDKHIDQKNDTSRYIVSTDQGVFQCDNSMVLGICNADEIYGNLTTGNTYSITTKGREAVNSFMREYPYIVLATKVSLEAKKD